MKIEAGMQECLPVEYAVRWIVTQKKAVQMLKELGMAVAIPGWKVRSTV